MCLIHARRARVTVLTLCVCVFRFLLPSIHIYTSNMTYQFTFRTLVLNFVDFDKKPSLSRKSVFHGYLVVYSC